MRGRTRRLASIRCQMHPMFTFMLGPTRQAVTIWIAGFREVHPIILHKLGQSFVLIRLPQDRLIAPEDKRYLGSMEGA